MIAWLLWLANTSMRKDEESLSSEDEDFTRFKAFMAIDEDELIVGKTDARSIIVPQQNTVFILDFDMEGKNEKSYKFTNVVKKAFGNMKWNLIKEMAHREAMEKAVSRSKGSWSIALERTGHHKNGKL
ncbi:hypothetical protein Tco_1049378 [Tanacetum coccineum]